MFKIKQALHIFVLSLVIISSSGCLLSGDSAFAPLSNYNQSDSNLLGYYSKPESDNITKKDEFERIFVLVLILSGMSIVVFMTLFQAIVSKPISDASKE